MASYNPFYVPSLKQLQADAAKEAQAQVNAAMGALPKTGDINNQFARSGRDLAGYDNAFTTFLRGQQDRRKQFFGTSNYEVAAGADPTVAAEAGSAAGANKFADTGFEQAEFSLQNAASANTLSHQTQNRRQMNDALTELAKAQSAEKAKYGALYYQILTQKKTDAFNAYQAYLANQQAAAQLGAQVSGDQANVDIAQQQVDIARNNAAADGTAGLTPAQVEAKNAKRNSASTAAEKQALTYMNATKDTTRQEKRRKWGIQIPGGVGQPLKTVFVEYPESFTADQVRADYTKNNAGAIIRGISAGAVRVVTVKGKRTAHTYKFVYNYLYNAYRHAGWGPKNSKKFAQNYITQSGWEPYNPVNDQATGSNPGAVSSQDR